MAKLSLSKGLKAATKKLINDLQDQYGIEDAYGIELLRRLAKQHTEIISHEETLNREGWTYSDRFGKPKPHPLANILRDTRSQYLQTLKALNLDIEPLHAGPGRPAGR